MESRMYLKPLGLFDVNNVKRYHYLIDSGLMAAGTEYGPLLTDGYAYCCPECGGHGTYPPGNDCPYCGGDGEISLDDPRVLPKETGRP